MVNLAAFEMESSKDAITNRMSDSGDEIGAKFRDLGDQCCPIMALFRDPCASRKLEWS